MTNALALALGADHYATAEQGELLRDYLRVQLATAGWPAPVLDRVRFCPICLVLFWAGQKNSVCCSENHRKSFNKRQQRARGYAK